MNYKTLPLGEKKRIALIAHDNKKQDLIEWAKFNRNVLADHIVLATGTTGKLLEEMLNIQIIKLQSGDSNVGPMIPDMSVFKAENHCVVTVTNQWA